MIEWFAHKSIKRVRNMLRAIRSKDLSARVPEENLRGAERELAAEINDVISDFRKRVLEQERRTDRYRALLDTIDTALIVAGSDGNVHFMNRRAVTALCGFKINNLSSLASIHRDLPQMLLSLAPGDARLITINTNGKEIRLKISGVRYSVEGEETMLFSLKT